MSLPRMPAGGLAAPEARRQALLDALSGFAVTAKRPALASAPLLLWGMSAGGEFNYEFVNWKADRVIAFVVNKGGIYYTALASRASTTRRSRSSRCARVVRRLKAPAGYRRNGWRRRGLIW